MASRHKSLHEKVKELVGKMVYIQIMGSFVPNVDIRKIKEILTSSHDYIKSSREEEVQNKLPELQSILDNFKKYKWS